MVLERVDGVDGDSDVVDVVTSDVVDVDVPADDELDVGERDVVVGDPARTF